MSQVSVKVSSRYQIVVPRIARERLNIQRGDRLLVDVQDGLLILSHSLKTMQPTWPACTAKCGLVWTQLPICKRSGTRGTPQRATNRPYPHRP